LLDTKTRWSSLYVMLKRFYKIRNAVRKALIDLNLQPSIVFTEDQFEHIGSIMQALEVVKLTVEVLCRRDSNLLTADAALRFMLRKLRAQNTSLSEDLANALCKRITQRRNVLSGVLQYLLVLLRIPNPQPNPRILPSPSESESANLLRP